MRAHTPRDKRAPLQPSLLNADEAIGRYYCSGAAHGLRADTISASNLAYRAFPTAWRQISLKRAAPESAGDKRSRESRVYRRARATPPRSRSGAHNRQYRGERYAASYRYDCSVAVCIVCVKGVGEPLCFISGRCSIEAFKLMFGVDMITPDRQPRKHRSSDDIARRGMALTDGLRHQALCGGIVDALIIEGYVSRARRRRGVARQ